ncbi:hybrid sensor histidine kinase/response regulator transcription factor [Algoriphagus algorifonticola]|uniref:hybrid sensor histidine kinase/response regulator transcription factor n=1 Tax=Algoriphagus algorifonticola TaxID=2593007 RepID=UPI00119F422B|nr:response regulator [Algoriphagus algorifonticola]
MKKIFFSAILCITWMIPQYLCFPQENVKIHQKWLSPGLSNNRILDIGQDLDGFLWMITEKGLCRYDGYEAITYSQNYHFIVDDPLFLKSSLFIDSKNRIWSLSGTLQPLLFDRETADFSPMTELSSVTSMTETAAGNFLFGTLGGQVFLFDFDSKRTELILAKTDQEIVKLLKNPRKPEEIIILFKNQVGKINTETREYQLVYLYPGKDTASFSSSVLDSKGRLWIGTLDKGLFRIDFSSPSLSQQLHRMDIEISSPILDLQVKKDEVLWIATYGSGLYTYDLKSRRIAQFTHQKDNDYSLATNDITTIFHDYAGITWIATLGAGLNFHDPYLDKFQVISNSTAPKDIQLKNIRALWSDSLQNLWIGTAGNGLISYNLLSKKWNSYLSNSGSSITIQDNRILSLLGSDHEIWIGYQSEGLSILNTRDNSFRHFNENSQPFLPTCRILKIVKDEQERFWLCTRNEGLIQFDPNLGIIKKFTNNAGNPNSFPDNHVRDLIQLNQEEFLVATFSKGLLKLNINTGDFLEYKDYEASGKKVTCLHLDKEQKVWVGTLNMGIRLLDLNSGEWIESTILEEFKGVQIHGLASDSKGHLWISSDLGISSIDPISESTTEVFTYTPQENSVSPFNPGSYVSDKHLGMFFGGYDGIFNFRKDALLKNPVSPKIALTKILVGSRQLLLRKNQTFQSTENDLTFYFSSLILSAPNKNQYRYRLLGYNDSWKIQKGNNSVSFANLNPGKYIFEVKGSNYDGIWNNQPAIFSFEIKPPWYLSIPAKIFYLAVLFTMISLTYRYLKWRWSIQYQLEIKNQETTRLKEIDDLKSEFYSTISHELRTPLTLIMGPTERLLVSTDNPVQKLQLNLIWENAQKLMVLIDQILSIRKISSKTPVLKIQKGNLGLVCQSVLINFHCLSNEKNLSFQSKIPLITEVWYDPDQIERILENLIYFIIQNAQPESSVKFNLELIDKCVFLELGYSAYSSPKKISKEAQLNIQHIKKLTEVHHGKFQLSQRENGYNLFKLEFPVDKYAYHPSQVTDEEDFDWGAVDNAKAPKNPGNQTSKILIVEDNQSLRNFLVRELCTTYHIIEAADGKSGIYEAYKHIPDLILTDIMMPEIDGLQLCGELKSNELTSHIPIILLTAKIDEETKINGFEVGADDYIQKPFSSRQLALRIQNLIELRNRLRIRYSKGIFHASTDIPVSSTDEKFLLKVQELVDSDFFESTFSIDKFSKKLGMSRMQLHRKLIALTGLSASAFIRDQRLRKSIQKLEKSDETVAEIAYSVGFSSPSYFIKCFKETFKITPLEYQQTHKQD